MTKTHLFRDATECVIRACHLITASQEAACAASSAVIQGYSGSGEQLLTLKLSLILERGIFLSSVQLFNFSFALFIIDQIEFKGSL